MKPEHITVLRAYRDPREPNFCPADLDEHRAKAFGSEVEFTGGMLIAVFVVALVVCAVAVFW